MDIDLSFLPLSRLVGGMLTLSPEYCFIVEDEIGLCGYVLAVLDSKTYYNKMEVSWIPEMLKKYPLKNGHEENVSIESGHVIKFIEEMHSEYKQIMHDPEVVYKSYPSMMIFSMMATVIDLSVPKRMLACVIAALKANGKQRKFKHGKWFKHFSSFPHFRLQRCLLSCHQKGQTIARLLHQTRLSGDQSGWCW